MKIEILPPLPPSQNAQDSTVATTPQGRDMVVVGGRDVTPVAQTKTADEAPAVDPGPRTPLQRLVGDRNVRDMTPRQMVDFSLDLYAGSFVDWQEYSMLAFQPDLHPDYDRTVGALTGQPAAPDAPRDYVAEWEDKLALAQIG